jgi:hypothetical protein
MFMINDSGYDLRVNSEDNVYGFLLLLSMKIWTNIMFH